MEQLQKMKFKNLRKKELRLKWYHGLKIRVI